MKLPVLELGLLATAFALSYPLAPVPPYPYKYPSENIPNVAPGPDHGSFQDVFDGQPQHSEQSYSSQYYHRYGRYDGYSHHPRSPYNLYPSPFYVPMKEKRRRCYDDSTEEDCEQQYPPHSKDYYPYPFPKPHPSPYPQPIP
ncbi:hypothetical protein KIN20_003670 [Parelaphostrongylus tenuis]|uniref:Uncharacterized protein n=1 Tax=Parelaphostrongylus tenuis TaxID=148309 RepID=A0AAD5MIR2_PARTN|nr:hypothetical protein KIN20_003670 [Parelaphostrongylus tenuis]